MHSNFYRIPDQAPKPVIIDSLFCNAAAPALANLTNSLPKVDLQSRTALTCIILALITGTSAAAKGADKPALSFDKGRFAHAQQESKTEIWYLKTEADLNNFTDRKEYAVTKDSFLKAEEKLAGLLLSIAEKDATKDGVLGSGQIDSYASALAEDIRGFQEAYGKLTRSNFYLNHKNVPAYAANFDFMDRHVQWMLDSTGTIESSLLPGSNRQHWVRRNLDITQHTTLGANAQYIVNVVAEHTTQAWPEVERWVGRSTTLPNVVIALSPEVRPAAQKKGLISASAVSVESSIVNVGGVNFSLFSLNPDVFSVGSTGFNLVSIKPDFASLLGRSQLSADPSGQILEETVGAALTPSAEAAAPLVAEATTEALQQAPAASAAAAETVAESAKEATAAAGSSVVGEAAAETAGNTAAEVATEAAVEEGSESAVEILLELLLGLL